VDTSALDCKRVVTQFQSRKHSRVTFMFPGKGPNYVNMGLELYQSEPTFREQVDLALKFSSPCWEKTYAMSCTQAMISSIRPRANSRDCYYSTGHLRD